LISTPAGILADKIGSRYVFALGLIIFFLVYIGFAFNTNPNLVIVLFAGYGVYIAFTDGVSKALIGEFLPKGKEGTGFGINQTVISITTVLASVIGGFLWTLFGSKYTFLFGSACSGLALILYLPKLFKSYTL
jgi:MFS family permease